MSDSLEIPAFGQYLEFIMDEVAMGQEFLTALWVSSDSTLGFLCQHPNINALYSHFNNLSPKLHSFCILKYPKM